MWRWGGCRKLAELEEQLIEEEVARRVKEQIEERVKAAMSSDAVQQSLQARLEAERKVLEGQVLPLETLDRSQTQPLVLKGSPQNSADLQGDLQVGVRT